MCKVGHNRNVVAMVPVGIEQGATVEASMKHHCREIVAGSQVDRVVFAWEPDAVSDGPIFVNGQEIACAGVLWVEFDDTFNAIDRALVTAVCRAYVRGLVYGRFPKQ